MSLLLPVEDVIEVLGGLDLVTEDEVPVLDRLITMTERLFLAQTNRSQRPFQGKQAARVEVHDGTGRAMLCLDYPIEALTSVLIGPVPSSPQETLPVSDPMVLRYGLGDVVLQRVDGGTFGTRDDPRVIQVTYDAGADLPQDAALGIQNTVVTLWRRRGSEDAVSERLGSFQANFLEVATADPLWQMAVQSHRQPPV